MIKDNYFNRLTDENYMVKNDNGDMVPNYDLTIISFNEGDILKGKVVKIGKDEVLIDVGYKSEGVIPISELSIRNNVKPEEILTIEDIIDIMVLQKEDQDGRLVLSKKRAEVEQSFDRVEEIYRNGETVEGEVIECVKGGLILDIGLRGFLPASLIDVRKTRELSSYIGEKCSCKIIEVDRNRNNVVLSRKAIIEGERKEQRKEVLSNIEVGQIKNGVITSIADFGAFVDVDGIDGLIHISELSWNHVKHPSEVVKINDPVSVEVLDVDFDKQRLSLGLKQTQKDPWLEKIKNFKIKDVVQGKVTRIVKFGLFVQIEAGMEGLVHISELSPEQIKRPSDVAKIGDELIVRIIDIDFDKRRMAFSVKQVEFPEAEEEKSKEEKSEEEKSEKPKSSKKADTKKAKEEEASEVERENAEQKESKSTSPEFEDVSQKEKKETIKKILSELKKEANLE
ncbi:MAG: 30S ribosomal protein S1 [Actinobacteria bacterium]|nr:30S ribosomal protein S1 [Actinomycetota bacterium]MCG2789241.1 30S ribosomal protein S1 [Actinomycetes bacterium]